MTPLSGAIAEHVLAGTVVDLQNQKAQLARERTELQIANLKQKEKLESDRTAQAALSEQIKEKQTSLEQVQDKFRVSTKTLNDLSGQLDSLKKQEHSLLKSVRNLQSSLDAARHQTGRQIRNSLIYAAATTASQIYDERLNDSIYSSMPSNAVVVRPNPVMNDNGKCFEKYHSARSFTWWELMDCAGNDPTFSWPNDQNETIEIKTTLRNLRDGCPLLTTAFPIAPTPGQGSDASIAEIVEFRSLTKYLDQPILRDHFCLDISRH